MSSRTIPMDDRLYDYMLRVSLRESEPMRRLREETRNLPEYGMQVSPEQAQFMAFLVQALGVQSALEVGVFTGYSSLAVAVALPEGGHLVACDVSEEWTRIARRYWREAKVEDRIELRLGNAVDTLDALSREGKNGTFDFAFVDADKENYLEYYERCLALVRKGGVIAFDNVLWSGRVADPSERSASTVALRALNERIARDERVALTLLPIGDGLTLTRKR
ncbi:MAG TPA: class I SAM-dependent methyltransferase [Polyangiaceae bacterium]|jgi:caffeoyl-CoA O-methyltransferase|nr:class I SAM-dependent methyltransferase [Polyangiaceae bacterium]